MPVGWAAVLCHLAQAAIGFTDDLLRPELGTGVGGRPKATDAVLVALEDTLEAIAGPTASSRLSDLPGWLR